MKKVRNLKLNSMQKLTPNEQKLILGGDDPTKTCPGWKLYREHWEDDVKKESECGCRAGNYHTDQMWKMKDFVDSESHFVGSPVEYTFYWRAHTVITYTRDRRCTSARRQRNWDWVRTHDTPAWEKWGYERTERVGRACSTFSEAVIKG